MKNCYARSPISHECHMKKKIDKKNQICNTDELSTCCFYKTPEEAVDMYAHSTRSINEDAVTPEELIAWVRNIQSECEIAC